MAQKASVKTKTNMKKQKTHSVEMLILDAAIGAATAAINAGRQAGVAVSVTVCDPLMTEIVYVHDDGATPHSSQTSRRKATTAASTRRATGWMAADLAITLPLASGNVLTNIGGGFPIKFDGTLVGALGVAGGTVQQDVEIAKAALAAIGADID